MAKKLRNTDAVFHAWAHQEFPSAECGNVSYNDGLLYSYAACIANRVSANLVVHTTRSWSPTTSNHQSAARSATNHMRRAYVYRPDWTANQNRGHTVDSIQKMMGAMPEPEMKKDGTEKALSIKRRTECHASALRLAEQFNEYLKAINEPNVAPIEIDEDMEKAADALREKKRKEKELAEKMRRQAEATAKNYLEAWRNHEEIPNRVNNVQLASGAAPEREQEPCRNELGCDDSRRRRTEAVASYPPDSRGQSRLHVRQLSHEAGTIPPQRGQEGRQHRGGLSPDCVHRDRGIARDLKLIGAKEKEHG